MLEHEESLIGKKLLPNKKIEFRGAMLSTNEFGLRDRPYTLEKEPGVLRIALLGGSYRNGVRGKG